MCRALDVAKYVINYEYSQNRRITNLRLQKLLYFVQAKVLCEDGNPCFSDEMEAWDLGPVSPEVYHTYKFYGALNIGPEAKVPRLNQEKLVNEMLDKCSSYSTNQLVNITHTQKPWIEAYSKGRGTPITNEAIRDYFVNGRKQ